MINSIIDSFSNIWYGLLASTIIVVLIFVITSFVKRGESLSLLCYAVGIVMALLLSFPVSDIIGGVTLKNDASQLVEVYNMLDETSILEDIVSELLDEDKPLPQETLLMKQINRQIDRYILKKIFWSILIIIVGGGVVIFLSDQQSGGNGSHHSARKDRYVSGRRSDTHYHRRNSYRN